MKLYSAKIIESLSGTKPNEVGRYIKDALDTSIHPVMHKKDELINVINHLGQFMWNLISIDEYKLSDGKTISTDEFLSTQEVIST